MFINPMFNLLQSKSTFTHEETFKGKFHVIWLSMSACIYNLHTF